MSRIIVLSLVALFGIAGCGGGGGGSGQAGAGEQRSLVSIAIYPPSPTIAAKTMQQFIATGTYSDGSKADLTNSATWTSSAETIATVDSTGSATSIASGSTAIKASYGGVVSPAATLAVSAARVVSIAIDPVSPSLAVGTIQQLSATGTFSDGTTQDLTRVVEWRTADVGIAAIGTGSGQHGKATTSASGTTLITATFDGVQASTSLVVTPTHLVSLSVTPDHPTIAAGSSVQLTAIGTFSDGSTQNLTPYVSWSSSASGITSVGNAAGSFGKATATSTGTATITATSGAIRGSTTLTVTAAYLASIAVTPSDSTLALGIGRNLAATGTYSDGSHQDLTAAVTWSSSRVEVATVSNAGGANGVVTPVAVGATQITASLPVTFPAPGTVSGSASVTVTPATLLSLTITPGDPTVPLGTTQQMTGTGAFSDGSHQDLTRTVTWSSSASEVAAISNAEGSNGKLTPLATGTATISASLGTVSALAVSVTVTPLNILNLEGTWVGTYTIYDDPANPSQIGTYDFKLILAQSGSTVTASPTLRGVTDGSSQLVGMVAGQQFSFTFSYPSPSNGTLMTDTGTAQVVGDTMTGNFVENSSQGYNCSYTFTVTRQN